MAKKIDLAACDGKDTLKDKASAYRVAQKASKNGSVN